MACNANFTRDVGIAHHLFFVKNVRDIFLDRSVIILKSEILEGSDNFTRKVNFVTNLQTKKYN